MSLRLGTFIAFISLAVWFVIYATYSNGSFLFFNAKEPDTGPIVWNFEQTARGGGFFLTMQKIVGQSEIRVIGFGAKGKTEPTNRFQNLADTFDLNKPIKRYRSIFWLNSQTKKRNPRLLLVSRTRGFPPCGMKHSVFRHLLSLKSALGKSHSS